MVKRKILVTGHKNPDTDLICSSIAYAHYKKELTDYMKHICVKENYSALILVMTNILDGGSEIVFEVEASDIIRQAFDIEDNKNSTYLKGVLSRKKQIIPKISALIEQ